VLVPPISTHPNAEVSKNYLLNDGETSLC
jgi:hypothetical protein